MIDQLIEEYKRGDAKVTPLLNYWNVYIVPSLNPDGKKRSIH